MTAPVPENKLRLGGMALRNGLLVHGPTHWAAAVRDRDGAVQVASGLKPDLGGRASEKVPGLRGVTKLAEAMVVIPLVKRALPAAKLPMQDLKTLGAMGGAALAGHLLRSAGSRTFVRETGVALISMAPAVLALRSGDLAAYHGVEHKSIAAYEQGGEAADATKEHDRCGSHLVAPMMAASALGSVAARRAGLRGPMAELVVGLGSAQLRFGPREGAAQTRVRDPARRRYARADGRAARGRARRARRDPARRSAARLTDSPRTSCAWVTKLVQR
jgi:hypothetical protein